MGFWKTVKTGLFGSPKTVDNVLDKDNGLLVQVGEWIGNQQFTSEEQAEMNAGIIEAVRQYAIATQDESTERSKTRRLVAGKIIDLEIFLVLLCVVIYPIDQKWAAFILGIAISNIIGGAFVAVIIFFFGSHGVIRPIANAVKKK